MNIIKTLNALGIYDFSFIGSKLIVKGVINNEYSIDSSSLSLALERIKYDLWFCVDINSRNSLPSNVVAIEAEFINLFLSKDTKVDLIKSYGAFNVRSENHYKLITPNSAVQESNLSGVHLKDSKYSIGNSFVFKDGILHKCYLRGVENKRTYVNFISTKIKEVTLECFDSLVFTNSSIDVDITTNSESSYTVFLKDIKTLMVKNSCVGRIAFDYVENLIIVIDSSLDLNNSYLYSLYLQGRVDNLFLVDVDNIYKSDLPQYKGISYNRIIKLSDSEFRKVFYKIRSNLPWCDLI